LQPSRQCLTNAEAANLDQSSRVSFYLTSKYKLEMGPNKLRVTLKLLS